jgi:hypothetical protein
MNLDQGVDDLLPVLLQISPKVYQGPEACYQLPDEDLMALRCKA